MPGMDGYQVCRLLKKDAQYNKIPIFLFTGKAKDKFEIVGSKVGANVTIRKPFDLSDILAMIEKLLKKSK